MMTPISATEKMKIAEGWVSQILARILATH